MGVDIDKLTAKANSRLHDGEVFRARTAGKIFIHADETAHTVKGFIGATDHRVIVLISPALASDRFHEFALTEVSEYLFNESENTFYLVAAGEHFIITDVLADPKPKDLSEFIRKKKTVEKTTFEATNLTIPAKK
jgi:hypothetical protein